MDNIGFQDPLRQVHVERDCQSGFVFVNLFFGLCGCGWEGGAEKPGICSTSDQLTQTIVNGSSTRGNATDGPHIAVADLSVGSVMVVLV